jgi:hypothetical protein
MIQVAMTEKPCGCGALESECGEDMGGGFGLCCSNCIHENQPCRCMHRDEKRCARVPPPRGTYCRRLANSGGREHGE